MLLAALLIVAAQPVSVPPAYEVELHEEAARFMQEYAAELRAGNRAAIAARYDRTGAWFSGRGEPRFQSHAEIAADYAGQGWQPPAAFEWIDLQYRPAGWVAVSVTGFFRWTPSEQGRPGTAALFRYNAVLVRQDGVLRIHREDEEPVAR